MSSGERWTVGRLLEWTKDYLQKQGSESPRLEAEVLLSHVLEWPRVQLYTHYEDEVGDRDRSAFRTLIRQRAEGAPVAYLVGRKEFFSLPLIVSRAVLIPRPDSEYVVLEFLELFKDQEHPVCVDVGTGSGNLVLACVQRHPTARFFATDISPEALAIARSNAEHLKLAERVTFRQGDLLAPVAGEGPFDSIVSNPPYIPTDVIPTLEPGVRDYEPHLALDGGPDGLQVVERLIAEAVPLLKPNGHLILEIGSDQEMLVRKCLANRPELELLPTIFDDAGHPRVLRASRRSS